MKNASERTLPGWMAFPAISTHTDAGTPRPGSLKAIKLSQTKVYRRHMAIALLCATSLHLLILFGFNRKTVKAPTIEPKAIPVELFQVPVEEPEATLEDLSERTPSAESLDISMPSQPELLVVPVASDFVIPPLPPAPANTGPAITQLSIPKGWGRGTVVSSQKIFNIGELDKVPEVIRSYNPVYPIELRRAGTHGLVVIQFIVDTQGDVRDAHVISDPHPLLGSAVTQCVSKWRFKPGMKGGRPVNTTMELPVEFKME